VEVLGIEGLGSTGGSALWTWTGVVNDDVVGGVDLLRRREVGYNGTGASTGTCEGGRTVAVGGSGDPSSSPESE